MDIGDLMKLFASSVKDSREKKFLFKLTPEEQARFVELHARRVALKKDLTRITCKIQNDANRLWADLEDKYEAHGKSLDFNSEEGSIYEVIEKE